MLSSADVRSARFTATKFREGYEIPEVDQVLDAASDTLAHLERGETVKADGSPLLTPNDLLAARFTSTRLREGYDVVEVDDLLDEIITTLNTYIARAQRGEPLSPVSAHEPEEPQATTAPDVAPAADVSAPSLATPADAEDLGGPAASPAAPVQAATPAEAAVEDAPEATPTSGTTPEPATVEASPLETPADPALSSPAEPVHAEPVHVEDVHVEEAAPAVAETTPAEPALETSQTTPAPLPWASSLAETAARHSDAFVPQWAPTGVQEPQPEAAPADEAPAPVTPVDEPTAAFTPTPAETPENMAPAVELPAWATSSADAPEAPGDEPVGDAVAAPEDPAGSSVPGAVDDAPLEPGTPAPTEAETDAPDTIGAEGHAWAAPASQPWTPPASSEWTATPSVLPAHAPIAADAFGVEEEAWAPVTAFEPITSEPSASEASEPETSEAEASEPESSATLASAPSVPEAFAPVEPEPELATRRLATSTIETATAADPAVEGLDSKAFLRQLTYARATSVGEAKENLTFRLPDGTEVQAVRVDKSPTGLVVELG